MHQLREKCHEIVSVGLKACDATRDAVPERVEVVKSVDACGISRLDTVELAIALLLHK